MILKKVKKQYLLNGFLFLLMSCAAIQSPNGGPKDITPPFLISTFPENGKTNFLDQQIVLEFSEYLNSNSIQKSIKILPAPIQEPLLYYKKKKITIELVDSLIKNQTYIIMINRNLTDEHNIKISQGEQIAFSTGGKIDNGSISGKVESLQPGSLNLWKIQDLNDKENFYKRKPEYMIDASDDGSYQFKYLSKGDYILSLVDQSMSGSPIFQERMTYGLSWIPVININEGSTLNGINLQMPEKINSFKINSIEWKNDKWGVILFSDNCSKHIPLTIFDDNENILNYYSFIDPLDHKKLHFLVNDSLTDYATILCKGIYDKYTTILDSAKIRVKVTTLLDTNNVSIIKPNKNFILKINQDEIVRLEIVFSSLMDTTINSDLLILYEDSTNITHALKWRSPLLLEVTPDQNWKQKTKYHVELNPSLLKPIYSKNLKDSLDVLVFETGSFQKFGTLNLSAINTSNENFIAELKSFESSTIKYNVVINSDTLFKMDKIPEGEYSLMFFRDLDINNKYSYGNIDPFIPAEWFSIYPDTIQIRSNWDLDINGINLGME